MLLLLFFEEALKKARGLATLPSVEEEVQSTEQFLARAKKRLEVAEKEVVACTEKRDSLRAEMVSAEERFARLKDEVGLWGPGWPPSSKSTVPHPS